MPAYYTLRPYICPSQPVRGFLVWADTRRPAATTQIFQGSSGPSMSSGPNYDLISTAGRISLELHSQHQSSLPWLEPITMTISPICSLVVNNSERLAVTCGPITIKVVKPTMNRLLHSLYAPTEKTITILPTAFVDTTKLRSSTWSYYDRSVTERFCEPASHPALFLLCVLMCPFLWAILQEFLPHVIDYSNLVSTARRPPRAHNQDTNNAADALCTICRGDIRSGECFERIKLCHHNFHSKCLRPWLTRHTVCPRCTCNLDPDDTRQKLPQQIDWRAVWRSQLFKIFRYPTIALFILGGLVGFGVLRPYWALILMKLIMIESGYHLIMATFRSFSAWIR